MAACPAEGGGGGGTPALSFPYVCTNGSPASGTSDTEGITRCESCDDGYTRSATFRCVLTAVDYAYICPGGTAESGSRSDTPDVTRCTGCDAGFVINGQVCNVSCSESSGTYTLGIINSDGSATTESFDMVTVAVGSGINFFTGVNDDGDATVDATYDIAETELTYGVWRAVRRWAVDSARGASIYDLPVGRQGGDDTFLCSATDTDESSRTAQHPVSCVSWYDSVKFANALSEYCQLTPVYQNSGAVMRSGTTVPTLSSTATGFRLPTGNEWELAARYRDGDTNSDGDIKDSGEFYPGNFASGAANSGFAAAAAVAWFGHNSGNRTHPVRQKTATALGLYDMSGNIGEWIFDLETELDRNRQVLGGDWGTGSLGISLAQIRAGSPSSGSSLSGIRLLRSQ